MVNVCFGIFGHVYLWLSFVGSYECMQAFFQKGVGGLVSRASKWGGEGEEKNCSEEQMQKEAAWLVMVILCEAAVRC